MPQLTYFGIFIFVYVVAVGAASSLTEEALTASAFSGAVAAEASAPPPQNTWESSPSMSCESHAVAELVSVLVSVPVSRSALAFPRGLTRA